MNWYKGFSPNQRAANLKRVKKAILDGVLEDPYDLPCEICGIDKGVREYHCCDYNPEVALKSLKCLCWKCHRNLHVLECGEGNGYYIWAKTYFENVRKGKTYAPTYTRYYTKEMEKEHENRRNAYIKGDMD